MSESGAYFTYIAYPSPGSSVLGQVPMGAEHAALSGTAAQHRVTDRATPGDLKNFYLNVVTNSNANTVTAAVRHNGSVGNLSIAIAGGTTGIMTDLSGSDSIADGDTFNHTVAIGLSGAAFSAVAGVQYETSGQFAFEPAAGAAGGSTVSTASTSFFAPTMGRLQYNSTESVTRLSALGNTTLSKLQFYVSANGRSTDTVVVSRNNAGDGNQTVTVAAAATGLFEDTSNSDSVSDGNYYSTKTTLGTGTGNFTTRYYSYRVETAGESQCPLYSNPGFTVAAGANTQRAFVCTVQTGGTPMPMGARASQLYIDISGNTVTLASTITLRIGGSNTALAATITASTTGRFIDVTNTVQLAAADLIDVDVTAGATGTTLTVREFGVLINAHATRTMTGVLTAQSSTMDGVMEIDHTMTGALQADASTIAGTMTIVHTLTGALVAGSAAIEGEMAIPAGEVTLTGDLNAQSATIAGIMTVGDPLESIDEFYLLGGIYGLRISHPDPGLIVQLQIESPQPGTWIDVSIPIIGDYDGALELPPGTYRFVSNVVGALHKTIVPVFRRGPL